MALIKYAKKLWVKIAYYVEISVYNLIWKRRFYSLGENSRIWKCDWLTNPKGISIGNNVTIRKGARLEVIDDEESDQEVNAPKLIIGDNTAIQFYFHCGAAKEVRIGKDVLIAGRVYISDHDHVYDATVPASGSRKITTKPVEIKDGVWIGEGVVILKGVTIGERSVIGANSVVTKDVPSYCVAAGVPAKVIKKITLEGV
ncbi:MAG: acyltransferase [Mariprofundaceae bacterium]|nr:acyltransferase [Mariprofundaceae bacterium]